MRFFIFKRRYNKGMTLVELLVALSIFAIISAITLFDYSSFRNFASLNNLANDISLSIRKVQSYSIGVKGNSGTFSDGYGVYFPNNTNNSFIIFADKNNDKEYDGDMDCDTENSECLEKLTISGGDKILGFNDCSNSIPQTGEQYILFERPNPDAVFEGLYDNVNQVGIVVSSSDLERKRIVCITNTGQMSVLGEGEFIEEN